MPGPQFNEPIEETYTDWYNPLDVEQVVDIYEGDSSRPTRYRFPPRATRSITSRHDRAIHTVHNGVVIGGLAPQLVNKGKPSKLHEALDTGLQDRKSAEADERRAIDARRQAEDDAILAREKARIATENDAARAKAIESATDPNTALPPDAKPARKSG